MTKPVAEHPNEATLKEGEDNSQSETEVLEYSNSDESAQSERRKTTVGTPSDNHQPHGLGHQAIKRYDTTHQAINEMPENEIDHALFGLLLSAENVRDEMRVYEEHSSQLLQLAHTGYYVRRIERLHVVLDAISTQYAISDACDRSTWRAALKRERLERVERYDALLTSYSDLCLSGCRTSKEAHPFSKDVNNEEEEEEALTLLKAALVHYSEDTLIPEEIKLIKRAFETIAQHSNMIVMSSPSWLVMPFEFMSEFGLSRWGNDVYYSDYSDSDVGRFIQDASTWSSLNHPHVAKFLGACHVGSRPFIVHERTRPLSECVREMTSREQVWRCVYEVALSLQYLHERGLMCGERLLMENVYCAELESKAMVFGAHLVLVKDDRLLCDGTPSCEPSVALEGNFGTDFERLCELVVNCLHAFSASTCDQSEKDDSEEASFQYDSLPIHKPGFIHESEWQLLMDMKNAGTSSNTAMLYGIERLREVAGVMREREHVEESGLCCFDDGNASTTMIESVRIPAIGGCLVVSALQQCAALISGDLSSKAVLSRLQDVYEQMKVVDGDTVNAVRSSAEVAQSKEEAESFVSLLVRFYHHLNQSLQSCTSDQWSMASAQPRISQRSVLSFHESIDRLISRHKLSSSRKVHKWGSALPPHYEHSKSHNWTIPDQDVPDQDCEGSIVSSQRHLYVCRSNSEKQGVLTQSQAVARWFISPSEIEFKSFDEFSRGAFGSVHHGKWFDTPVVVKSVLMDAIDRDDIYTQFLQEADTWFELNHINVVKMYGACHIGEPFFVCEYASGGDLSSYLREKTKTNDGDMYEVWYSLLNAALGLQYLHDKGIVHADLKANNVLVGGDGIAKLADFGLSKSGRRDMSGINDGGARGAYRWKAPECLPWKGDRGESATFASDVYSFAMMMIEVASGEVPWGDMLDAAVVFQVKQGRLPPRPACIADSEWQLIERMCCLDPSERVTIDAVVVHLSSLLERMDMSRLWSPVDGRAIRIQPVNHVVSRSGTVLSLIKFMKSSNTHLAFLARNHFVGIQMKRSSRSDKKEIEAIVDLLACGSDAEKQWAALALGDLVFGNSANGDVIASCGAIQLLVWLARDGNEVQKMNATHSLANLAINSDSITMEIASCGAVPPLVSLLRDGTKKQIREALRALLSLATIEDCRKVISSCGGIAPLIALVREGDDSQKGKAAGVLRNLAVNDTNKVDIAMSDGIDPLLALAQDGNDKQKVKAIGALANLAGNADNRIKIAASGIIERLVEYVWSGNDEQKGPAAGALWNLAVDNERNKEEIASCGGIGALLALISNGDNSQMWSAMTALENLATNDSRRLEISSCGGIALLVGIVRDGSDVQKAKAINLLYSLARNSKCQDEIGSCGAIDLLVGFVQSGSDEQKESAAGALMNLVVCNEQNCKDIVLCGGIQSLVALVRDGNEAQKENAAGALVNLAISSDDIRAEIASCGGIGPLVTLAQVGNDELRTRAAFALWILSTNARATIMISQNSGIAPLVALLQTGNDVQKYYAVNALRYLALRDDNKLEIAAYGGIDPLVTLVRDGNDEQKETAASALWNLTANNHANKQEILSCEGIPALTVLVKNGTDQQKRNAAGALWNLAYRNPDGATAIRECGAVDSLLSIVMSGTESQKELAAGVLAFLGPDVVTKRTVASHGGIHAILQSIHDTSDDDDREEGLVALQNLCCMGDPGDKDTHDVVHEAFIDASGVEILSQLLENGSEQAQRLASVILSIWWD